MLDVLFSSAEGFSSSLDFLYGGLGTSKLQFFVQKNIYINFSGIFSSFRSSEPWNRIRIWIQWMRIHNTEQLVFTCEYVPHTYYGCHGTVPVAVAVLWILIWSVLIRYTSPVFLYKSSKRWVGSSQSCGSVTFWYRSESADPDLWLTDPRLITFWSYICLIFKDKKLKSQNSRTPGFSYYFAWY